MNYSDAGIGAVAAAIVGGAFQWLKNVSTSKEKIALRKLDIEAKTKEIEARSKEYVNAILGEYNEKQSKVIKDLEQKISEQSILVGELKQIIGTLGIYFKAVAEIAENNVENAQIRSVVKGMQNEADKLLSKIKIA